MGAASSEGVALLLLLCLLFLEASPAEHAQGTGPRAAAHTRHRPLPPGTPAGDAVSEAGHLPPRAPPLVAPPPLLPSSCPLLLTLSEPGISPWTRLRPSIQQFCSPEYQQLIHHHSAPSTLLVARGLSPRHVSVPQTPSTLLRRTVLATPGTPAASPGYATAPGPWSPVSSATPASLTPGPSVPRPDSGHAPSPWGLALAPDLVAAHPPLVSGHVAAPPPAPLEILAGWRTYRVNPLSGFTYYSGGWNILSVDYWVSLAWSGFPASAAAAIWVLGGLLVLSSCLTVCLCCRGRWGKWRTRNTPASNTPHIVAYSLGGCCLALCIAGFVTLSVGQVGFWGQAVSDMEFIFKATTAAMHTVQTLAHLLDAAANVSVGNGTLLGAGSQVLSGLSRQALAESSAVEQQVLQVQDKVDSIVRALSIVILLVSSVFLLLILCSVGVAFSRLQCLSYVMVSLVWLLCAFSLAMLTVSTDLYYFIGDTEAALNQVEEDPGAYSAMDFVIPCTNQTLLNFTRNQARQATYTLVDKLNTAWVQGSLPPLTLTLHNKTVSISHICNPFQGPPDFLPATQPCLPNAPNLTELAQSVNATVCENNPSACTTVGKVVKAAELVAVTVLVALQAVYPSLGPLVNCQYVAVIAAALLFHAQKYIADANLSWVGFLTLCLGSMILSLLLPFYVFIVTRTPPVLEFERLELSQRSSEAGTELRSEPSLRVCQEPDMLPPVQESVVK